MSQPDQDKRRPRAFRLEPAQAADPQPHAPARLAREQNFVIEPTADPVWQEADAAPGSAGASALPAGEPRPRHRLMSWAALFWSAIGGLLSLSLGLWCWRLVNDLFSAFPALGWLGAALAGLAVLALLALAVQETAAIFRLRQIARLHAAFASAHAADDAARARAGLAQLLALYAGRPGMARPSADLGRHMRAIIDGRDLINIAERDLIAPLDAAAQREIAQAARRVSAVTAISPRALLDVLFVLAQSVRLLRRIAAIYGGRPGLLGFLRLASAVGAHLAVTGGMAVGDSLVQQLVGHGIAARLSARLGEGVLNGLLTARVGLAAMAVCRPMPFNALPPPGVRDVAPFLFGAKDK